MVFKIRVALLGILLRSNDRYIVDEMVKEKIQEKIDRLIEEQYQLLQR